MEVTSLIPLPQPQNEIFLWHPHPLLHPYSKLSLYFWGWEGAIFQYPDFYQKKNTPGSHSFTYKYLLSTYYIWAWL